MSKKLPFCYPRSAELPKKLLSPLNPFALLHSVVLNYSSTRGKNVTVRGLNPRGSHVQSHQFSYVSNYHDVNLAASSTGTSCTDETWEIIAKFQKRKLASYEISFRTFFHGRNNLIRCPKLSSETTRLRLFLPLEFWTFYDAILDILWSWPWKMWW